MMEDRSGLFNEIQGFSQRKLKKVETKVVTGTGDKVVEKRGAKGLQTLKTDDTNKAAKDGNKKKLDLQVGLVIPGLLIASDDVATHKQTLEEYAVTHILNLCSGLIPNHFEDDYNYCNLDIRDSSQVDLKDYFDECFEFIDEGRHRGNCLVHCDASVPGLSRSTSICVAYLMCKEKKKFNEAYNEVKEARPFVKPNEGFMRQLNEYENELFGAKKQEDVQDAFTLKKRQEIEAEKEMLKSKISIKDKMKAFATTTMDASVEPNKAVTPSTPNRMRDNWMGNTMNSVDKDPSTPSAEERPAPRKLTSILSIFQPKEAKENQQPNKPFVKNTAPTRKWKPVEVTTLQGTKGPEVKKGFTYDKVRKSKSKEWKGREVKKTKSKVLSKSDSIQKEEPKAPEKEPVKFAASVTVNNPTPKPKSTPAEQPNRIQKQESLKQDPTAPWRKPRDVDKISPAKETVVPSKPVEAAKPTMIKKEPPKQMPPPPPPQPVVRQIPIQNQSTVQNAEVKKPEPEKKEEISPQKKVFGRIPPPPMKIIGRDVSLSDDRKFARQPSPPKPPPQPQPQLQPQSKVTNITITSTKKEPPPPPEPPKKEVPKGQLVKTITLEESSEEEEDEEEEDEEEEDEEEESEEEEDTRRNSKAGLNRSSTLEILKLIKSKTQVLDDKPMLNAVDEDEEIDTLLDGLEQEGIDNIDWAELGIELNEVKNIVKKNQQEEEEEEEEDEEEDEEEEEEVEIE